MSDCFDLTIIDQLRADLARVTAELKSVSLSAFTSIKNGSETIDALRSKLNEYDKECTRLTDRASELEMDRAALRARVAELEERATQCEYFREQDTLGLKPLNERAWKAEQRNAELEAALPEMIAMAEAWQSTDGEPATEFVRRIKALARAEQEVQS